MSEPLHPHRVVDVVEKCKRCEEADERKKQRGISVKRFFRRGLVVGVLLLIAFSGIYLISTNRPYPPKSVKRETKCYFVRHAQYERDEHLRHEWDPWYVWESERQNSSNWLASGEAFRSKNDAWAFIKKWNLEPCR